MTTGLDSHTNTVIGRWTAPGDALGDGCATVRAAVPAPAADAVRRAAAAEGVPLSTVLFAIHTKVISALSSERDVVTGRCAGARAIACHVPVPAGSWRQLIAAARDATETGGAEPAETQFDPRPRTSPDTELAAGAVLSAGYAGSGADLVLHLTYRRTAFRPEFAERALGYYATALHQLAEDPDGQHDARSLLSDEEIGYQRDRLAGPVRELPGTLFVELFEERVAHHRDDIAAVHGDRRWTYAELNRQANAIAHWLLKQGLTAEDSVTLALDRTLEWLAAIIGVFKAGGVYLPASPRFPADRMAAQLERSGCRFALTEPWAVERLAAVAGTVRPCQVMSVAEAQEQAGAVENPGVAIEPGQLAYIYFTSGSTGLPKGAMCEHAGMLNHLFMKVEDMGLRPGETVTQTASQTFDISLWQLIAPLLVGGTTEIIDSQVQLDIDPFLDRLAAGGIQVVQLVPAYLDVLLSQLEARPRPLGDLRRVSVTGEALKLELVRRWFALFPDISLVNAYGATEVSDDTMHEILTGPPARDFVSVGTSRHNVATYILDERQRMVPLGAPGEIAFSGVAVGRGYINDPERTAQAFLDDPYRPGERLYRTGDYGRWLPEGTIEFLGRRDEQVKIRGYRIEIGEIENQLLRMPGVDQAAVVIAGDTDQTRSLVAFYSGPGELEYADLRDFLAASLPDYMIPAYFYRLDSLPLTENGKIAKKRLTERAEAMRTEVSAYVPPATETERQLATAWSEVLGVPLGRISREDDFFAAGGTSLAAVRLVLKLDRRISLRRLTGTPVLRELAAALDDEAAVASNNPDQLLQPLSALAEPALGNLVCFPYAGGNAVNFQQVAAELAARRIAVYGLELPGHDIDSDAERLADVEQIAARAHQELKAFGEIPTVLLGHCAGGAHALELSRLLEADGNPAVGLVISALLLDDPAGLHREMADVRRLTNREIVELLHDDTSYVELDDLKAERADLVGRAYRHDVISTDEYLLRIHDERQPRLRTPVQVLVAADDPTTTGFEDRYRDWELIAEEVRLRVVDTGRHYFVRENAAEVAAAVLDVFGSGQGTGRAA